MAKRPLPLDRRPTLQALIEEDSHRQRRSIRPRDDATSGLPPAGRLALWSLVHSGAPIVLGQLVLQLVLVRGLTLEKQFDYIEYFSGEHALSSAMRRAGCVAATYDKDQDPIFEDILTDSGFTHALHLALSLRPGGGSHSAIKCSSFVRINFGTSGRTKGRPLGNECHPSVQEANMMASRMCLLIVLLNALGAWVTIEQPSSSTLEWHPRVQLLMGFMHLYKLQFNMWNFGGPTRKPSILYSSLARFRCKGTNNTHVKASELHM